MPILSNGQTVTDEQAKSITDYFSTNPNANQIAERAASLGLTKDQLASAAGYANFGTNQAANIDSYMQNNTGGYTTGANGVIMAAQKQAAHGGGNASDTMQIGNHTLTRQQLQDFYSSGGNDGQIIYQQGGITDAAEINRLSMEARKFAGNMPTGDAALQMYFKQYQQSTPNGASANDFEKWRSGLAPGHEGAMRSGGFTGLAADTRDNGFGAIHGPGSDWYEGRTPNYAHPYYSGASSQGSVQNGNLKPFSIGASGGGGQGGGGSWGSSSGGSGGSGNVTPWNVGGEQTVEGRINGILNPNNPIIQQARTQAMEGMNARGLKNSSIATTAADAAAYQAAIPIAAADAATFGKAAGYNADQSNQFTQAELNRQSQWALAQLSADTQKATAQLNAETQKYIAGMDSTYKNQALDIQTKNQTLLQTNSQASQAFNTAMSAMNNITNNAGMDATAKTQATANVWRSLQVQLDVLGKTSGINLSGQLNFSGYPGFDAKGNWVGFDVAAPAVPDTPGGGILDPNKYPVNMGGSA